ncbi:hypothetical protein K504DRAFT_467685 [Pleomassaria siparia CBS 279.74]|uniref:RWD domain-containing protein n=1 Tax=Pleomassaria siparia CBS 279.74 TaxID=1314801 RepID=A0A6G1KBK0_9PLEO|nr:hypothetical protein K504DRAFT_467685 [Pleomassaria siparia CBS 279.74]
MSHQPDESRARLATELELLEAMFPSQVTYSPKSRELIFTEEIAQLHLRLPELYPCVGLLDVISARDASKRDVRDVTKEAIKTLSLADGEEVLDAVIASFQRIVEETIDNSAVEQNSDSGANPYREVDSKATRRTTEREHDAHTTVIIWLHHLLALGKRKMALAPAPSVSGITKPGYPGIMVFSGPSRAVMDHVKTLKAENWQAFQIRYEGDEAWEFAQRGVVEVESMSEVVAAVGIGENAARRKKEFLEAVGIK